VTGGSDGWNLERFLALFAAVLGIITSFVHGPRALILTFLLVALFLALDDLRRIAARDSIGRRFVIPGTFLLLVVFLCGIFIDHSIGQPKGKMPVPGPTISVSPPAPNSTPEAEIVKSLSSQCTKVTIYTGQEGTPYNLLGTKLADDINQAGKGWQAVAVPTLGSAINIDKFDVPDNCAIAIAGLRTVANATYGREQYDPKILNTHPPIPGLRIVGQVYYDLYQIIVRDDTTADRINSVADLCGHTIASGVGRSGTQQSTYILLKVVGLDTCKQPVIINPLSIEDGIDKLAKHQVDAVFWSAGAPTRQVLDAQNRGLAGQGPRLRLFSTVTGNFYEKFLAEWRTVYPDDPNGKQRYHGEDIYTIRPIGPREYPGIEKIYTLGLPNGLVVRKDTDEALVTYLAWLLHDPASRKELEKATLGADNNAFVGPDSVRENPIFCLLPIHDKAAQFYDKMGVPATPSCPKDQN
jgi:TRAP-type uncharacterized transport system substrate-binding protein